ncbi:MAG: hypothetical protein K0S06_1135 [Microvirga sp.]|jgi:hypothetical protein|nr:hypothetical protein [Microvirga sp.]
MGLALSVVLLPAAAKAEISIAVARIAEGYLWVIGQAAESEVEMGSTTASSSAPIGAGISSSGSFITLRAAS